MHGLGVWLAAVGVTMALVSVARSDASVAMVLMVPIGFFAMSFMMRATRCSSWRPNRQARGRVMALLRGGLPGLDADAGRRWSVGSPRVLGARLMFLAAGSLAVAVAAAVTGEPVRLPHHPRRDDAASPSGALDAREAATA